MGKLLQKIRRFTCQKYSIQKKNATVQTLIKKENKWEKFCAEQYKKMDDSTYQVKSNGENMPDNCLRTYRKQSDGLWMFKDLEKGNISRIGYTKSMIPLLLEGEVIEYFPNGNMKSKSIYKNNELVSNENWLENGDKYIDNVFYSVDTEPTFNSGMTVLHQHIKNRIQRCRGGCFHHPWLHGDRFCCNGKRHY